jgi:hypothetical protein
MASETYTYGAHATAIGEVLYALTMIQGQDEDLSHDGLGYRALFRGPVTDLNAMDLQLDLDVVERAEVRLATMAGAILHESNDTGIVSTAVFSDASELEDAWAYWTQEYNADEDE